MRGRRYDLDFIRAISCILVLIYHLSGYWYDGHGIWSWCNIGVQVFFFLSGYLAAIRKSDYNFKWVLRKLKRVLIPYWVYLTFIIPVIFLLDSSKISIWKVLVTISGFIGLFWDYKIEPIGVLWFVSYILICYMLTPFINWYYEKVRKKSVGKLTGGYGLIYLQLYLLQ